jgi:biopolymer transport protein ExbD
MYKIPAYACLAVLFVLAFVSWAQGSVNPVDLSERPEFKSVGTNEEARERGVSFWVVVSKSGIRLKNRAVDSLAALDAEMESAVHEAKLTPEEASRAPVTVLIDGRATYGKVASVLSTCSRLGLKTVALEGDYYFRGPMPLDAAVALPVVAKGVPVNLNAPRPKNWIVLDVRRSGLVSVNGEGPYPCDEDVVRSTTLARRIVEAAGPCRMGKAQVLIRADEQVPSALVKRVICTCTCNQLWDIFVVGQLADGRECIISQVYEPCPCGFWWGGDDELEEEEWLPELPPIPDVKTAKIGDFAWSYVVEKDGSALIWGGTDPDRQGCSLPAVSPKPTGELTIPQELDGHPVLALGDGAFGYCPGFTAVHFPPGIKRIGSYALANCRDLVSAPLPDSVVEIGSGAFNWTGLTHMRIPAGVTYVDYWTFSDVPNLEAFEVDENNPCYSTMGGVLYNKDCSRVIRCPQAMPAIEWAQTVREIAEQSFANCSFTNICLPSGLRRLDDSAFIGCGELTSIEIPEGIEELPSGIFMHCSGLQSVRLPETLEAIGSYAFSHCESLTKIVLPQRCRHVDYAAFNECTRLAYVRLADDTSFLHCKCFDGVSPDCVFSLGHFWRYNPSLRRRVPSPLSWTLLGVSVISVFVFVFFAKRHFCAQRRK